MTKKLPSTKPPPRRKHRRSGLEVLWKEEPPTLKKLAPFIPPRELCPACKGSTFSEIQPMEPPSLNTYRVVQCPECLGEGDVSPEVAESIRRRLKTKPP